MSFRWRDYRHHNKLKMMTLAADEFIRRFLLHTLPDGAGTNERPIFVA